MGNLRLENVLTHGRIKRAFRAQLLDACRTVTIAPFRSVLPWEQYFRTHENAHGREYLRENLNADMNILYLAVSTLDTLQSCGFNLVFVYFSVLIQ